MLSLLLKSDSTVKRIPDYSALYPIVDFHYKRD